MQIPSSATDEIKEKEIDNEKIIINPYCGSENLTRMEAIDCINRLSGMLLADGYFLRKK